MKCDMSCLQCTAHIVWVKCTLYISYNNMTKPPLGIRRVVVCRGRHLLQGLCAGSLPQVLLLYQVEALHLRDQCTSLPPPGPTGAAPARREPSLSRAGRDLPAVHCSPQSTHLSATMLGYSAVSYNPVLYSAVLYISVLSITLLYNVQCCTEQCCVVQFFSVT